LDFKQSKPDIFPLSEFKSRIEIPFRLYTNEKGYGSGPVWRWRTIKCDVMDDGFLVLALVKDDWKDETHDLIRGDKLENLRITHTVRNALNLPKLPEQGFEY
jgi:hypothetical protein